MKIEDKYNLLLIGDIDKTYSEDLINLIFSKYGEITEILFFDLTTLYNDSGLQNAGLYCLLEYKSRQSVSDASFCKIIHEGKEIMAMEISRHEVGFIIDPSYSPKPNPKLNLLSKLESSVSKTRFDQFLQANYLAWKLGQNLASLEIIGRFTKFLRDSNTSEQRIQITGKFFL